MVASCLSKFSGLMPWRAFVDSDSSANRVNARAQKVLMPLRAFVDSDIFIDDLLTVSTLKVLMPLRAFVDSDGRAIDAIESEFCES